MTRDVAARLHFAKPGLIHARFLDALQGPGSKMSASVDSSAIFMKDDPNKIKNKVNKYAFSGGQATVEEQRAKGGDTEKDVSFQYLTFFLEDDEELERIRVAYTKGEMLTGELKAKCIAELQVYTKGFQERRAAVTDAIVEDFMSLKRLEWKGNPNPIRLAGVGQGEESVAGAVDGEGAPKLTQNQIKKLAKQKAIEEKKAKEKAEKEAQRAAS
jgi:tryptophanyl-tRNA synthetase